MWDPHQYEIYADHRGRPFHELVGRVGASAPERIVDLGCGTGALTATLLDRWPDATVTGVDSSAEMLAEAARHARPPQLTFDRCDVTTWVRSRAGDPGAGRPVDVIVSNAMLQWVPGHADLLPGLVNALTEGGWLSFAVPGNFDAPSHTLLGELRRSTRWRATLGDLPGYHLSSHEPAYYHDRLAGLGCVVDAWETTYLQVLSGTDPVLEWMRGTGLRPVLAALGPADADRFASEYGALLREAYPAREYGTLLPYRRVFVVARRS